MSLSKDVAFRRTIEDYTKARDNVVALIGDAETLLGKAEALSNSMVPYGWPHDAGMRYGTEHWTRELDERWWRALFDQTGLPKLMDASAIAKFKDALGSKDMPEFTQGNIEATFLSMFQQRDEMFARGVYNVFRKIHRWKGRYVTNDREKFGVGNKIILEFSVEKHWSGPGVRVRYGNEAEWNDIDRCFRVIAGMDYEQGRLTTALNQHYDGGNDEPYVDELFKIRCFRNGNSHVWFLNDDALAGVNKTIADYCDGNAIPDAT